MKKGGYMFMKDFEYPTEESIETLCKEFDLQRPDEYTQNWEYEVLIETSRIREFIKYYQNNQLNNETRFTLMILIVSLLNDAIGDDEPLSNDLWNEVLNVLVHENKIHMNTILYWAVEDEDEQEYAFPVTPYMRHALSKIKELS